MSTTQFALTGLLPAVLIAAVLLAYPLCWMLLRLYRRAVLRGMNRAASATPGEVATAQVGPSPLAPLKLQLLDRRNAAPSLEHPAGRRALHGRWRIAAVHAAGGLVFALVMTFGWLMSIGEAAHLPIRLALITTFHAWAAVLAVAIVAGYDVVRRLQLFGAYAIVVVVLSAIALRANPHLTVMQLVVLWLILNGPPTLLFGGFLLRPVRAVGPLVLLFLLCVVLGSQLMLSVFDGNVARLRGAVEVGELFGLGAYGVFVGLMLLGAALAAVAGWLLLWLIGWRYRARGFSDQMLTLDALFLLFGVEQSLAHAFEGVAWVLAGPVAFIAYRVVVMLGFRLLRPVPVPPATLLLLRVFRLGARSERLFDRLRRHWQPLGPIRMIAGPDLVTTTVEPHEFLDFVSGALGRQFVAGDDDLTRRLAESPATSDPDGRYRIDEFFCRIDTWQLTMERLAARSDAVLMDLRSFAPANQGCVYELGRLLDDVPLGRLVVLIDDSTDRVFLEAMLARLWSTLAAGSPNRAATTPPLRVFHLHDSSETTLARLLAHLLARPLQAS